MIDHPFLLSGKTIFVTGASSGIGRACAILCSELGASVILSGRSEERLKETFNLLSRGEGTYRMPQVPCPEATKLQASQTPEPRSSSAHRIMPVDITRYDDVASGIEKLEKDGVVLHGLVNSAGISTTLPLRMIRPEKAQALFETNVNAGLNLCRLVTRKKMVPAAGQSIVLISSVMGITGEAGKTLYSITKGALIAASRSLAIELAPKKIRVNCISPGVVETPMSGSAVYSRSEESREQITARHPLGLGQPQDVACACAYLLSDAARWITGSNLVIDGGYTAR